MTTRLEYSGAEFGLPKPALFSKSWRIKRGLFAPKTFTLAADHLDSLIEARVAYSLSATSVLQGQDAITAGNLALGLPVYAGYFNGTYANLNAIRARVGTGPVILSVTPNGANGARCIDVEPGDATPAACPGFWHNATHGGGQKDTGLPMIYTSAGDVQAVINAMTGAGIARNKYLIWSAHWIGNHICGPHTCGYPQADATQYASPGPVDLDAFYSYCFVAPSNPIFPLVEGDVDVTTPGPVRTLQNNLNKWESLIKLAYPLTPDGDFGPATKAAVALAQVHFGQRSVAAGTCNTELNSLLAAPLPVPPKPPVPPVKPPVPPVPPVKPPVPVPPPVHPPVPPTPKPAAPTGLKSSSPLVVSWTATHGATKYDWTLIEPSGKVYRSGNLLVPQAVFEDLVAAGGHGKWTFKVSAVNVGGSGPVAETSFIL